MLEKLKHFFKDKEFLNYLIHLVLLLLITIFVFCNLFSYDLSVLLADQWDDLIFVGFYLCASLLILDCWLDFVGVTIRFFKSKNKNRKEDEDVSTSN